MIILLTNDDGIGAPGLRALFHALEGLGDRWVVAPAEERSGVGHGFTQRGPLTVENHNWDGSGRQFAVAGTPADAVKLAVRSLLPEKPALVVSGINLGENTGVDLLYSGTVAAAREGAVFGAPAVAISRCSKSYPNWEAAKLYARRICLEVLEKGLPTGILLNVNVPPGSAADIHGVRITRQTASRYEEIVTCRPTAAGQECDWVEYRKLIDEDIPDGDIAAVRQGWVSVTPVHHRLTDFELLNELHTWGIANGSLKSASAAGAGEAKDIRQV